LNDFGQNNSGAERYLQKRRWRPSFRQLTMKKKKEKKIETKVASSPSSVK
jgi:hypothetical protein